MERSRKRRGVREERGGGRQKGGGQGIWGRGRGGEEIEEDKEEEEAVTEAVGLGFKGGAQVLSGAGHCCRRG